MGACRNVTEFDRTYDRLAETGACDAPGSCEYRQILTVWLFMGRPPIELFIREMANRF